MIPLPDGLEWEEWWGCFVDDFARDGIPDPSTPWREAVERAQNVGSIPDLPTTEGFDDWREWARRAMTFLA